MCGEELALRATSFLEVMSVVMVVASQNEEHASWRAVVSTNALISEYVHIPRSALSRADSLDRAATLTLKARLDATANNGGAATHDSDDVGGKRAHRRYRPDGAHETRTADVCSQPAGRASQSA